MDADTSDLDYFLEDKVVEKKVKKTEEGKGENKAIIRLSVMTKGIKRGTPSSACRERKAS